MSYRVRYTREAAEDLERLFDALLQYDWHAANRAMDAIEKATSILEDFPFTCRKTNADNPFMRELLVSFGSSGYVALYEIDDDETVSILAARHQREDDYH